MPSLGADMTAGTLAKWRVAVGDSVSQGDIIAEVETEKGLIEVEVFETGVVQRLLVEEGEKVPVGTPLAEIGEAAASESVPATLPAMGSLRAFRLDRVVGDRPHDVVGEHSGVGLAAGDPVRQKAERHRAAGLAEDVAG